MKKQIEEINTRNNNLKRKHLVSFLLNDYEKQAVERYCKKYRVKNKSKFFRETAITVILKKFNEDYPTLF